MATQSIASLRQRAGSFDWGHAVEIADIRGAVAITGVGESAYSGASGGSAKAMALEAVERSIADAGLTPAEIDGLMSTRNVADQITPRIFTRISAPRMSCGTARRVAR